VTRMLVLAASIASGIFTWLMGRDLPEVVAYHFDATGHADAFASRAWFVAVGIVIAAGIPLAVWTAYRAGARRGAVNIPHRDRWLSAQCRAAALAFMDAHMAAFIVALATFESYIAWCVAQANATTSATPHFVMGQLWIALAAFMAFVICWSTVLQLRFRRPASD